MIEAQPNEKPQQPKKEWVEPKARRIVAGGAELTVAVTNDGPGDES